MRISLDHLNFMSKRVGDYIEHAIEHNSVVNKAKLDVFDAQWERQKADAALATAKAKYDAARKEAMRMLNRMFKLTATRFSS